MTFIVNIPILVPTLIVTLSALNNQQVGDPLLLECNVTTVRGITSSVDIVWSINDTVVKLVPSVSSADNSVVYRSTYDGDGLLLSKQHNGVVYQCIASINSNPLVEVNATYSIGKETVILYSVVQNRPFSIANKVMHLS